MKRQYAWEPVGTAVAGVRSAEEAMERAGLDWEVELKPLGFQVETAGGNRTYRRVKDAFAIVRETDGAVLGRCSKRYTPVQNAEAFSFVDGLAAEHGLEYGTAAALRGGKMIVLQAKLPEAVKLAGSETELHLLFVNHHTAGGAVKAAATPVVLACTNMLNLALGSAERAWSTWHFGSFADKVEEAHDSLGLTAAYVRELGRLSDRLAAVKLNEAAARGLAERLVPERPRSEKLVDGLMRTYLETGLSPAEHRGDGFGFVNAVGEFYEWEKEIRSDEARLIGDMGGFIRRQRDAAVEAVLEVAA